MLGMVVYACNPSYSQKQIPGEQQFEVNMDKIKLERPRSRLW
jgi:hypothetical protein